MHPSLSWYFFPETSWFLPSLTQLLITGHPSPPFFHKFSRYQPWARPSLIELFQLSTGYFVEFHLISPLILSLKLIFIVSQEAVTRVFCSSFPSYITSLGKPQSGYPLTLKGFHCDFSKNCQLFARFIGDYVCWIVRYFKNFFSERWFGFFLLEKCLLAK